MKTFVITENTEPVNALKTVKLFIDLLENDLYNWKWIIIIVHNCVQNFMVSSLRSGNNLNVLEKRSAENWFVEFTNRMKCKIEDWTSPREKLDYFLSLYEKVKSDKMLFLTISKKLETDNDKDEAMKWLNQHRNSFIHFVPSTFEMNVVNLPQRMVLIMGIIRFLVSESGNIVWFNIEDKASTEQLITELIEKFNLLNQTYTTEQNVT